MNNEDWQEIRREEIFRKFGRGIEKRIYRMPDGKEAEFYLKNGHSSVACVALTKDKQVVLVKQFRPGPAKMLLELPGGVVEEGESLEEAITQELFEESGYSGEAQFVSNLLPDAYTTYEKNFFVVTNCEKIGEPQQEANGEELEVVLMSLADFRKHIRTGQMTDVEGSYLCLDFLGLL